MTETSEEILISALPEKCTKQHVLTAMLRPKCLSSQIQKDRFTAGIVFLTTGRPEKTADIKPEFRFEITENRGFSGSCDVIATARCPFRFAQADSYFFKLQRRWICFFLTRNLLHIRRITFR
jgi:hypothetical protein